MRADKSKIGQTLIVAASFALILGVVGESGAGHENAKYAGVDKCKNCHEAESKGDQWSKWKSMAHSKAWETLASDEAKKIAKEKGLGDPRKADQCVKCHVTAFGVSKTRLADSFDETMGVQCETCHGPGEVHVDARLKAAAEEDSGGGGDVFGLEEGDDEREYIPESEITREPDKKGCLECHNDESPTFEEFNFEEAKKKIAHPDPRPRPKK